jgi:hypothetical protein
VAKRTPSAVVSTSTLPSLMSGVPPVAQFDGASDFRQFLVDVDAVVEGEDRFPARNFRLDEGVASERATTYRDGVQRPTWKDWPAAHRQYLERHVEWTRGRIPPLLVDPASGDTPDTFGEHSLSAEFGQMSARTSLVRVTTPWHVARDARVPPSDVTRALTRPGALEAILWMANAKRERLPEFVAIWDDVADLLPLDAVEAPSDWANQLRDRLGLSHYAVRNGQPQEVLVFVFPVSRVPKRVGSAGYRALTIPTVLDARFFPAFCPAPMGTRAGRIVDLSARLDEPKRELLIPPVRVRESDLFRSGEITEPAPALTEPRVAHLMMVRDEYDRPDYAAMTDGDLL